MHVDDMEVIYQSSKKVLPIFVWFRNYRHVLQILFLKNGYFILKMKISKYRQTVEK